MQMLMKKKATMTQSKSPCQTTQPPCHPDLNHSLLAVRLLVKAGCEVKFTNEKCIVTYKGKTIMTGIQKSNGLWYVPISPKGKQYFIDDGKQQAVANSAHHQATMPETIKFIHQCLFLPTVDTLCKAINNNQLIGFPSLTAEHVRKYLPESTAAAKGHMNRTRKGIRSTTKQTKEQIAKDVEEAKNRADDIEKDFNPPQVEDAEVELFVNATIGNQNERTVYTDQTGSMPVPSFHGKRYHFVAYEYQSNAIIVRALKDLSDNSMVEVFKDVYDYLTSKGFKPKLNVMDNACSRAVQKYIKSTEADIQLVNPDDHRVNACKQAIQTWKNHWIAGLSTVDPACPLQLCRKFIEQGQDTLNLLRKARVNPKLSAYAILEGQFNFNKMPLAPVGTKALVFLDPKNRKSFQTKAMNSFYCGPAKMHYRNYTFYVPETRNYTASPILLSFSQRTAKCLPSSLVTPFNLQHKT
jgi:hypothetical protein